MLKSLFMKNLFWILIGTIYGINAFGQQIPLYSQYHQNPFIYNPGKTGEKEKLHAYVVYRKQWVDFEGAPETRAITLDGTVKDKIGLGAYIYSDFTDIIERYGGSLSYAYYFKFAEDHKLAIGISAGLAEVRVNFNGVILDDPIDKVVTDDNRQKALSFDGSAGINYWFKGLQLGFSVPQLIETKLKYNLGNEQYRYQLARHYLITASYDIAFVKDVFYFEPGVMFRTSKGKAFQVDVGGNFKFKEIAWVGAMYRYDYALSVGGGVKVHDRVSLGYAYDISMNNLKGYSGGTHEALIGIKFGKAEDKGLIEAIKKLETAQDTQAVRLNQLDIENEELRKENEEIKNAVSGKDEEFGSLKADYGALKEEMDNLLIEFRDSLNNVKREILSQPAGVVRQQQDELNEEGAQVVSEQDDYMIVIGSFRNKSNAKRMADLVELRDYQPGVIYNKVLKNYYVYVSKYDNYNAAKGNLERIKSETEFKDAWIYIKNK